VSAELAAPSRELAARILSEVPFAERLPAGRFRPPAGILQGHVRSLSALFLHLAPQPSSIPGVNLKRLADWIGGTVGDTELADRVREAVAVSTSHVDGCLRVYDLVGRRIAQAERVMEPGAGDGEERNT
jgi:hypothetical protein